MKQFEYKVVPDITGLVEIKRRTEERVNTSAIDLEDEILNELGMEGWDLTPRQNGYFAKREVKYAKGAGSIAKKKSKKEVRL